MTDKEKAIVMAYTGTCMLTGDKFSIFHEYVEHIMGRPVCTHELAIKEIADEIKEKAKADFIALCAWDELRFENCLCKHQGEPIKDEKPKHKYMSDEAYKEWRKEMEELDV